MGTSVYSFGEDSPAKFRISDRLAKDYNEAAGEFYKTQQRFNQRFGKKWDPTRDPIKLRWSRKHEKAWNTFAKIFNATMEVKGPFHENDFMEDFLVKNAAPAASEALSRTQRWNSIIVLSACAGAFYGLLKGLNNDRS